MVPLGTFAQPSEQNGVSLKFNVVIPPLSYGEQVLGFIQMHFNVQNSDLSKGYRTYLSCAQVSIAPVTKNIGYTSIGNIAAQVNGTMIQSSSNQQSISTLSTSNGERFAEVSTSTLQNQESISKLQKSLQSLQSLVAVINGFILAMVFLTILVF